MVNFNAMNNDNYGYQGFLELIEFQLLEFLVVGFNKPFPEKGRDKGIVRSRSCDESNIVKSRILRTTGPRPRSTLRHTIYRSEELSVLFTRLYKEHARGGYYAHRALASPPELRYCFAQLLRLPRILNHHVAAKAS
ncbi:hypothetical protein D0Y65_043294 [Glycine soja]|uniref:Uncharacterized protein n=1 Tax=Glycine soja TaxID=3848 RepID=A0A445GGT9_GLYSO|nr:hypothetical protein D0Y65_043294 [Glycine soja]